MDLVVDANITFAAIIKESKTHEIIFDGRLHLFTTVFFFAEFKEHSKEIQKKTETFTGRISLQSRDTRIYTRSY